MIDTLVTIVMFCRLVAMKKKITHLVSDLLQRPFCPSKLPLAGALCFVYALNTAKQNVFLLSSLVRLFLSAFVLLVHYEIIKLGT